MRIAAGGFFLSTLVAVLLPHKYEAVARLMPSQEINSTMPLADALGAERSSAVLVGMLQSRTVADHLINKFGLRKIYRDDKWEDARKDLKKNSDIGADTAGIIAIRVRDGSPDRAAAMAKDYTDELNFLVRDLDTSSAHRERLFLEQRLAHIGRDLEIDEKEFSEFASRNLTVDMQAQVDSTVKTAEEIQRETIAEQAELEDLKTVYSDGNVQVRATQTETNELERQMAKLVGASPPPNPAKADAQTPYRTLRELALLGTDYADLSRSVEMENTIFQTLTREYEAAKLAEVRDTPSVQILDRPQVPEKEYWHPRIWMVVLSTTGCFALGVAWILGVVTWKKVNPDDPWKLLATDVLHTTEAYCQLGWKSMGARNLDRAAAKRLTPGR